MARCSVLRSTAICISSQYNDDDDDDDDDDADDDDDNDVAYEGLMRMSVSF
jgi:hypothetical protein